MPPPPRVDRRRRGPGPVAPPALAGRVRGGGADRRGRRGRRRRRGARPAGRGRAPVRPRVPRRADARGRRVRRRRARGADAAARRRVHDGVRRVRPPRLPRECDRLPAQARPRPSGWRRPSLASRAGGATARTATTGWRPSSTRSTSRRPPRPPTRRGPPIERFTVQGHDRLVVVSAGDVIAGRGLGRDHEPLRPPGGARGRGGRGAPQSSGSRSTRSRRGSTRHGSCACTGARSSTCRASARDGPLVLGPVQDRAHGRPRGDGQPHALARAPRPPQPLG